MIVLKYITIVVMVIMVSFYCFKKLISDVKILLFYSIENV